MKVLVLLKHSELDHSIINFAATLLNNKSTAIHLLNIVSISGEIPTQNNGSVVENCTEFDLTGYYSQAEENRTYLQSISHPLIENKSVLIGNRRDIIKSYIEINQIDLIVSGAHKTTLAEDVFTTTFASDVLKVTDKPFLSIKCNRDNFIPNRIALIGEFVHAEKENLEVIKNIAKIHNSDIILTKILTKSDHRPKGDIIRVMQEFAVKNDLIPMHQIIESTDRESGVETIHHAHQNDLITIARTHESTFSQLIHGSALTNIVNHIYAPILIY